MLPPCELRARCLALGESDVGAPSAPLGSGNTGARERW